MKKETSKKIAAAAAMLITASSIAGCSSDTQTGEVTTADTTPTTVTSLKAEEAQKVAEIEMEVEELENKEVKWFSFWDINPVGGKAKPVALELFEKNYGGKITYIPTTWENKYSDLATLVLGGDSPDMFPASDFDTFPGKTVAGMFDPLDDYVDFDSDMWSDGCKQINELFTFGGKHYIAATSTDCGVVCIYNKRVVAENGLTDPAELLADGNWNWNTFKEMLSEFTDRESGKFGYDGWWFEPAFMLTTGVPSIGMENGKIVSNIMSPELERVENFMLDLKKDDLPFPHAEYDWNVFKNRIGEGTTLFWPEGIYSLTEGDLSPFGEDDEVMFVPLPKDPSADEYYLPTSMYATALCKGAKNPKGVAAYINCLLISVNDETADEVTLNQYKEDYGWSDEMLEMYKTVQDLTNAHPVIDFYPSINTDVYDLMHNPLKDTAYNGKDWATTRSEIADPVQIQIDEMNKQIEEQFGS